MTSHRNFVTYRYLSKKDIKVIAGCGCPSIDRKVVNSGKRLRAYVGIDEGNVCIPHSSILSLYVAFFIASKFNRFLDSHAYMSMHLVVFVFFLRFHLKLTPPRLNIYLVGVWLLQLEREM